MNKQLSETREHYPKITGHQHAPPACAGKLNKTLQ